MIAPIFVVLWAVLSLTLAAPQATRMEVERDWTTTSTISATLTFSITTTKVVTLPTISTSSTSSTTSIKPTYTATEIYAFRPNSPIHLLPFQAAGYVFRLGGSNAAYCPSFAEKSGGCGSTDFTGINQCQMSVIVPGGQSIYLAPDGSLRYTQPHSQYIVPGSLICPLSYTQIRDSDASEVMVSGFGATGWMACPMLSSTRVKQQWQVYADTVNASVPLRHGNGNSSCWNFEAFGIAKNLEYPAAAWQYA